MIKIKRMFRRIMNTDNGETNYRVYDSMLSKFKRQVMDVVFSLAISLKISPKKLANAMEEDKLQAFAKGFVSELHNKSAVELNKLKKELDKQNLKTNIKQKNVAKKG